MGSTVKSRNDVRPYDATVDGERDYKHENAINPLYDANLLYDAFRKCTRNTQKKEKVQKFEMHYLTKIGKMQQEIEDKTFQISEGKLFVLNERGKPRPIHDGSMEDKIVEGVLSDYVLVPNMKRYLIYDNGAGLKDKGVSFARERLEEHLHEFYRENGSNDGYIVLMDYSKYYDNIRHKELREMVQKYVDNIYALWILDMILKHSEIDVSYMTDEEYATCLERLFNMLEYAKIDKSLLTGEKMMKKHTDIGKQPSQICGIAYPIPVDNFIKIVKGVKRYARYSDDSYIIHESREALEKLVEEITEVAKTIGITINTKKLRICKLSEKWRFMQVIYTLSDTGKVIKKINPEKITRNRKKMRKLAKFMEEKEFENWYKSWFRNHYKLMSKAQRNSMDELYKQLRGEIEKRVQNHTE